MAQHAHHAQHTHGKHHAHAPHVPHSHGQAPHLQVIAGGTAVESGARSDASVVLVAASALLAPAALRLGCVAVGVIALWSGVAWALG